MSPPRLDPRRLETPDGATIAYRMRAGRSPWVLLHGLGCDASMWDEVVAAIPAEVGVVVPEIRGHGASTLGWRTPSVDLWAEDVERIVRREALDGVAIAGLSMGGYAAFAIATRFPYLARGFAFVSTTAAADDEGARDRRAAGQATLKASGWRALAVGMIPSLLLESRADFPRHRDHVVSMFERAGDSGLSATLFALASRPDRRDTLPYLTVPSVVVVGEADLLIPPEKAEETASSIPGARLVVLPGTAHLTALEAPRALADVFLDFGA